MASSPRRGRIKNEYVRGQGRGDVEDKGSGSEVRCLDVRKCVMWTGGGG